MTPWNALCTTKGNLGGGPINRSYHIAAVPRFLGVFLSLLLLAHSADAEVLHFARRSVEPLVRCAESFTALTLGTVLPTKNGKYKGSKMETAYWGEDLLTTRYYSRGELKNREIIYQRETKQWEWLHPPKGETKLVPEGNNQMVMSVDGHIYLLDNFGHHSAGLRGRPVGAAGWVTFDSNASLRQMSTSTGHYWRGFTHPDGTVDPNLNWRQFVREIRERGAETNGILVHRGSWEGQYEILKLQEDLLYSIVRD